MAEPEAAELFEGHLVVDWKKKSMRVVMRKPKNLKPFEIAIHVKLKLNIPEQVEIVAEGEIDIPANKVKEMNIHSI